MPARPLVVTFDDGHKRNAELAEVCDRHGVVPTIYVCSQIVGTMRHFWFLDVPDPEPLKPLSSRQRWSCLEVAAGFSPTSEYPAEDRQALSEGEARGMLGIVEFGSHSRFHPVLTTCTDDECRSEIVQSKEEVERLVGTACQHFSYPNGDYTEREVAIVRQAGYASARTVDYGWNGPGTDPFKLRILGTSDDASINRLAADLSGITGLLGSLARGRLDLKHRTLVRRNA